MELLATLEELGIGLVPYSPLGKGFLTGKIDETHHARQFRLPQHPPALYAGGSDSESGSGSAHFSGAYVTFEPGARSAWHIHPKGQHLLVTAGVGRTGDWDGRSRRSRRAT